MGAVLGAGRELDLYQAIPLPDFGSFSFPAPAEVALTARRVGRSLGLEGTIDTAAGGACARCLDDVRLPIHLEFRENIELDGEKAEPLGENNVLVGDQLDLPDLVRQLIDSALPIVLLCNEECQGLCPACGKKRDGMCTCPQSNPE
jgi:uncharacterized protein